MVLDLAVRSWVWGFRDILSILDTQMDKKMQTEKEIGWGYRPPQVDRTWGIWGSYCKIPKAIFYLLKGDYNLGLMKLTSG